VSTYAIDHPDMTSCKAALTLMSDLVARVGEVLPTSDNYVKLVELQREISGFDTLVQPERMFIREGCLQKLSRKGYQQRMFFLVSSQSQSLSCWQSLSMSSLRK
jgi:FERM/RhoGEF/pleckstrin domain protein 2